MSSGYCITSLATREYNCIAWAAGDTSRFWWPDPMGVAFWPSGAPREETIEAFLATFEMLGFRETASTSPEHGVTKIALYARGGLPTHMARQLPSGRWTSKLGRLEDIEHDLRALTGGDYGSVISVMARSDRGMAPRA